MSRRYAILLDGGFVVKRLFQRLKRPVEVADVLGECRRIEGHPSLEHHYFLRIYFYDALPASGRAKNPVSGAMVNLGRSGTADRMREFHDKIELATDVAFRRGEVTVQGWKLRAGALSEIARTGRNLKPDDLVPNIQQKASTCASVSTSRACPCAASSTRSSWSPATAT